MGAKPISACTRKPSLFRAACFECGILMPFPGCGVGAPPQVCPGCKTLWTFEELPETTQEKRSTNGQDR
jgi:hypothetical protein